MNSESSKKALITIPAVQGYLKVLVLSVSAGHGRTEGGGSGRERKRESERDKGDVGRQVVSECKGAVGEGRWGGQAVKLLQQWRHC